MLKYEELEAQANQLENTAKELKAKAQELRREELKAQPLADRLVYSAYSRCPCGAGLAYDPCFEDKDGVFVGPLSGYWDCSAILLGVADPSVQHTGKFPFAFYEIKSEKQASASGASTRPKV